MLAHISKLNPLSTSVLNITGTQTFFQIRQYASDRYERRQDRRPPRRFSNNPFLRIEPDLDPKIQGQTQALQQQIDDNFNLILARHRLDMKVNFGTAVRKDASSLPKYNGLSVFNVIKAKAN
eukprot:CAMPEP_0175066812 /NCGR_PEP_ID=MMETSP0052_2-20121109/16731_1 /TAXON_ID=51329 ORGANISM="Polytomella parva, Strain SAG 63-3" /NCGR_SAMPLE_ID=MMETSP0052_2 /ASSEMBLY_ACC=CAM_ASM_000194 /LENGTH=121 /DNA_ID=CAMNT_0016333585 /DNA_START=24 /DNA_END=389 /DNA_ORIENTATION=-